MPIKLIVNAVLFQAGWFACVLGGTSLWLILPFAFLVVHFSWISSWDAEGKMVLSVMLAGGAVDSFLLQMGVLSFPGEPWLIPLWLAMLWALLATTLNHCLAWSGRRWWHASMVGAAAGPLAYIAGAALSETVLPLGILTTAVILGLVWAVLFPLLHGFANLYREQYRLNKARSSYLAGRYSGKR